MTAQSNFEKVSEFHEAMEARRNVWPPPFDIVNLRQRLIYEEVVELNDELDVASNYNGNEWQWSPERINKQKVAKELADVLYVVYGTADAFGIDIDRVFAEVHRSNMSKLVDGKPLKRDDGKVLKGPNYTPPNLDFIT